MSASSHKGGKGEASVRSADVDNSGAKQEISRANKRKLGEGDANFEEIQLDFDRLIPSCTCSGSIPWPQASHLARALDIYYESKGDGDACCHMKHIRVPALAADLEDLVHSCGAVASDSRNEKFELCAKKFASSFDIGHTGILHEAQRILAPECESIMARPWKLNIYQKGGMFSFFDAHKYVAPSKADDLIGSLVVCLPQSFTGGDLVVKHQGRARRHPPLENIEQEESMQWVAFTLDCEQEVEQVTSGTRITLTYTLHRGVQAKAASENMQLCNDEIKAPIDEELYKSIGRLIASQNFKGILGFPLEHVYVSGSTFKGRDMIVFNTLALLAQNRAKVQAQKFDENHKEERPKIKLESMLVAKARATKNCWRDYDDDEDDSSFDDDEAIDFDDDEAIDFSKYMYIEWDQFEAAKETYFSDDDDYDMDEFLSDAYGAKTLAVKWVQAPAEEAFCYMDTVSAWGNQMESFYAAGCLLLHIDSDSAELAEMNEGSAKI
jgi:hypothetical protein